MKILVCASEYYPYGSGIAIVAYNIIQQFRRRNIDCTVCSPIGPDIVLGNPSRIQRYGIVGLIDYWNQVSSFFNENDFDVAWLHNPFFLFSNPFQNSIVTMNSTYYGEAVYRVGNSEFQILYKKFVAIIEHYCLGKHHRDSLFTGVGQNICDELEHIGVHKDKIRFIPNGIDCQVYTPAGNKIEARKKFGIPEDHIVLLSIGRLVDQKQPEKLVELMSLLEHQGERKITLCIAGRGALKQRLLDLILLKSVRKVVFLDYVDQKDLPDLYACSDYFIIASKYEGGSPPLTVLEAMASGLPIIASDIPNFQIVKEAECGIIVNLHDMGTTTSRILDYILKDNSKDAKNARKFVTENFDWSIIAEKYLAVFDQIDQKN